MVDDALLAALPPGWATDLGVLLRTGSRVEDRGDHLVVRTPDNPGFYWGNFLLVTDAAGAGDADRWLAAFAAALPDATHLAVGLVRAPADPSGWARHGLTVEVDDVLVADDLPQQRPLPDGYAVRRLATDDDWEQHVALALRENARTGEHEPAAHERFVRARTRVRRVLADGEGAAWFGAFDGDGLAADLGIVVLGPPGARLARYQDVGTDAAHRRRGLAGHLLGVAARWAADRGARRWVILTEATNPAGRVYRSVGLAPVEGNAQVERRPPATGV